MDLTTALVNSLLDEAFNNVEYAQSAATKYLSAWNGDPFNGGTEVGTPVTTAPSGTNYNRASITFSAASGRAVTNSASASITMPPGMAAATPVSFLGVHTDQTTTGTGTMLCRVPILGSLYEATADVTTDTFTTGEAHGLVAGDRVVFDNLATAGDSSSTTLGGGLTAGTVYYVRTTGLTSYAFTVSTTGSAGTVVDLTGTNGFGVIVRKLSVQTFNASNILQVASGQLAIRL